MYYVLCNVHNMSYTFVKFLCSVRDLCEVQCTTVCIASDFLNFIIRTLLILALEKHLLDEIGDHFT